MELLGCWLSENILIGQCFIKIRKEMARKAMLLLLLIATACSQGLPGLDVYFQGQGQNIPMILDAQPQPLFIETVTTFDCSLPPLFSYRQTNQAYDANSPYPIQIDNISPGSIITLTTIHNKVFPTFQANCAGLTCFLLVSNNCSPDINFFNYFDRFVLTINTAGQTVSATYYILCNSEYLSSTFEWGLLIEICFCSGLIALVAVYSRAWSLGGMGVTITWWMVVLFNVLLVLGGLIGYFSNSAINIVLAITSFGLGTIGTAICVNEVLFLLRLDFLRCLLVRLGSFELRVMEVVSLCCGAGVCVGWWFSGRNMIVNDIVCCCMIVGFIKILKFTSLRVAGLCFVVTMSIQMIFVIAIHFEVGTSYNDLFLNNYNFPLELQAPTINAVYNQKCAWLPFTAIVYPGMLLSYLRRFDSSRNTNVYLITSSILFFVGGIAWMFISIANPFTFPLGLVSEPCMFGLVCIFAYRRREIRVLWDGKFYDEEFADQEDLKHTLEMIARERRESGMTIDENLIEQLKERDNDSRRSDDSNVIRSKFLKG